MLMMRRHEKDFLARHDSKYLTRFDDEVTHFNEVLDAEELPEEVKDQLRGSAMQKIQVLVARKQDKFLGGWLSEEARTAAMQVLHG